MNKTAMVFFTLLLVLASCFIAGCSSLPFSPGTPAPADTPGKLAVNAGIAKMDNTYAPQRFQYDQALTAIISPDTVAQWNDPPEESGEIVSGQNMIVSGQNLSSEKQIKMIIGKNLDEGGNASSWTFIVEHGGQVSIVTYGRQGMVFSHSPGSYKGTEIFTDRIISPPALVEKNRAAIFNTSWTGPIISRDLTLYGDHYSMTISGSGTPRVLIFDAKTGVLISSND